jgi:antitoxin (DNA-binding transcriptional repressor) of toxin-antitoxin stability system
MKTTVKKIGTRELLRDIKNIKAAVKAGQEFEVHDRATPLFRIVPITATPGAGYTFADLAVLQFSTDELKLSQQVDDIVYGR